MKLRATCRGLKGKTCLSPRTRRQRRDQPGEGSLGPATKTRCGSLPQRYCRIRPSWTGWWTSCYRTGPEMTSGTASADHNCNRGQEPPAQVMPVEAANPQLREAPTSVRPQAATEEENSRKHQKKRQQKRPPAHTIQQPKLDLARTKASHRCLKQKAKSNQQEEPQWFKRKLGLEF